MLPHPSRVAPLALLLIAGLTLGAAPTAAQSPFSSLTWRSIGPVNKALEYAVEAAGEAVAALDRLVGTDIPAAYQAAGKPWANPVKAVATGGR